MKPLFAVVSIAILLMLNSCGTPRRYKPVVKYSHPSPAALQRILPSTYGKPYRYAGQGPNRFDCSGLVYYSYATMNLWLPRRSIDQSRTGKTIRCSDLKFGDLIFFDTRKHFRGRVNHVGIYLAKGTFLHANSTRHYVTTGKLNNSYYTGRVIVCKRVLPYRVE